MSKFDKKDAYKLIPAKKRDWNKQGFRWLGRYFLELQQIFGGIPSVCNFDRLGNTIMAITLAKCEIPRFLAFRTLDDVPVVAPNRTIWCEEFSATFKKTCRDANIRIAPDCPDNDKAFTNQTVGTVLGIRFNTNKMEWSLHKNKADELIRRLLWAVDADCLSLKQTQQLLGSMNDLAQMCPFIKPYKALLNGFLKSFGSNEQILLKICDQTRKDLLVCANVADSARKGIPIPVQPMCPSLHAITCYSDAAGSKFAITNGERRNLNREGDRGVASIVLDKNSNPVSWSRLTWPIFFLNSARDEKGAHFGSKSTTLETIGMLMPFLYAPEKLAGKHVVFRIDNIAVFFGWENKVVKNDTSATIIIRAIHLISYFLGTYVHVQHVPRCSDKFSTIADHLSRKSTTGSSDTEVLKNTVERTIGGVLLSWLNNPISDWKLPERLLEEVIKEF
jgi:hypothetical protein